MTRRGFRERSHKYASEAFGLGRDDAPWEGDTVAVLDRREVEPVVVVPTLPELIVVALADHGSVRTKHHRGVVPESGMTSDQLSDALGAPARAIDRALEELLVERRVYMRPHGAKRWWLRAGATS